MHARGKVVLFVVVVFIVGFTTGAVPQGSEGPDAMLALLLILLAFAIGLGMVLGVVNVFFRDVGQLFTIALQFGFWLTPVVYPLDVLPQWAQDLMQLNPMAPLMAGFQISLVARHWPDWGSLVYPAVLAGALCWLGQRLFRNLASDMLDEL